MLQSLSVVFAPSPSQYANTMKSLVIKMLKDNKQTLLDGIIVKKGADDTTLSVDKV